MKNDKLESIVFWVVLTTFLSAAVGLVVWLLIDLNQAKIADNLRIIHDEAAALVSIPSAIPDKPRTDKGKAAEAKRNPGEQETASRNGTEGGISDAGAPEVREEMRAEETPRDRKGASINQPETSYASTGDASASEISLSALYSVNPDLAGWIRILGTEIDYPFAAIGNRKNKYLDTAYDGRTKSSFGTIFTRNNLADPDSVSNLVLYGHNMSGAGYGMFTQLLKYKQASFAKSHADLLVIIGETPYKYTFFCAYNVRTSENFSYEQMAFTGPKDLARYTEEILKRSTVKAGGATAASHYVTLSTCDRGYDYKNGRFVVVFARE